jgi:hypothetical protein
MAQFARLTLFDRSFGLPRSGQSLAVVEDGDETVPSDQRGALVRPAVMDEALHGRLSPPSVARGGYGMLTGRLDERVMDAAAIVMIVAAVVSTGFIVSAYWRSEM